MITLAIDCANFSTSLALFQHNQILAVFKNEVPHQESATLISRIQDLFKTSGQSLSDLKDIVVTTGPGSFTGIRLGIAAARGLSFALKIPIYAVNSFNWVAHSYQNKFGLSSNLLVVLESRREEVFFAFYCKDLISLECPRFLRPEEITSLLNAKQYQIVGDAAGYFNKTTQWMPNACDLISYKLAYQNFVEKFDPCRPYYIRAPEIHGIA